MNKKKNYKLFEYNIQYISILNKNLMEFKFKVNN